MRAFSVNRLIRREAKSLLLARYRDSLLLSSCLCLLCGGVCGVYRVLTESLIELFPFEARGILSELFLYLLFFLTAPIFGGILAAFPKYADTGSAKEHGESEAGRFLLFCRSDRARRSARLAVSTGYGLFFAARMLSNFVLSQTDFLQKEHFSSVSESVVSASVGLCLTVLYAAVAFLMLCLLCVMLSGKLFRCTFGACFFQTVKNMLPLGGQLLCGLLPFAVWCVICYFFSGIPLLLFVLPYRLYYLHFFGVYADCRRFAVPSGKSAFPIIAQYE